MAVGAGDAAFDFLPFLGAEIAGAALVPVFPGVGARAEHLAAIVPAQHRPRRHEDHRQAHRDRPHDQARCGLVAPAHQHRAVDRMRAQKLFGFHRQHVAVEHGRRLDVAFRERQRRQFHREPAGFEDAALHVLDALLEMDMARVGVRPGVEDGDDRLVRPFLRRVAHLHRPRTVAEAAQVVRREPARAAQVLGSLVPFWHFRGCAL